MRSSHYCNDQVWQQLLSLYLPNLQIFDFHNVRCPTGGGDNRINEILIKEFRSRFFLHRNWFFTHGFVHMNTFSTNGICLFNSTIQKKIFYIIK